MWKQDRYLCRKPVTEIVEGQSYTFDSTDCALMFKKFRSVYGPSLFSTC